ncbi:hypothetical protein ISG33_15465 [Glaciecola sp. MH2013]|uniref:hypothetical protein n=1 Tax=Glaciecola sp. MH2013 TaxID=2785524 RepID=UPI00189E41B4|nr:hypothetical protein [Glaciecola sp. MH2013]MBF7074800.1 hypothetical protein [Glaciecola sp. MH2013]
MKVFKTLAMMVACVFSISSFANVINVAVIGDNTGGAQTNEVIAQLNDSSVFNFNAVSLDQSAITDVTSLNSFDTIILGGSGTSRTAYSTSALNAAFDFMSNGGGVVTAGWWHFAIQSLSGAADTFAQAISPALTTGSYNFSSGSSSILFNNTVHPITLGISDFSFSGCCLEEPNGVDVGATALAQNNQVVYQDTVGRSVYLGPVYMSNGSYSNDQLRSGNGDQLFEQAVAWSANGTSVSVSSPATIALFLSCILLVLMRRKKM